MTLQSTTFADVMMEKRVYVPIVGFFIVFLETPAAAWLERGGRAVLGWAALILTLYAVLRELQHLLVVIAGACHTCQRPFP